MERMRNWLSLGHGPISWEEWMSALVEGSPELKHFRYLPKERTMDMGKAEPSTRPLLSHRMMPDRLEQVAALPCGT